MKSGSPLSQWPPKRQGLVNVIVLLLFANLLLLIALLTSDVRITRALWWPEPTPPPPSGSLDPEFPSSSQDDMFQVILNTTSLDLTRGKVRTLRPHGIASHLIVEYGSYRNGPRIFSIVSLISKRLHDLHQPPYSCEWRPEVENATVVTGSSWPIKPDWKLGAMYGTMVVVCEFTEAVGTAGEGGQLILSVGYPDEYRPPETFVAFTERPGEYNATRFAPPYPYDITFCVSRLYGNVDPQRIREWIAYHAHLLGNRTHFMFHDVGGLKQDVYQVLKPWVDLGRVSIQNLQLLELYEGGKHHQFTMLNDCMFRAQTLSNWTFFFDVDEYLYLPPHTTVQQVLAESERKNITQIRMKTVKMSDALCTATPAVDDTTRDAINARKWAFEKLVYANCDYGWEAEETRKYVLQPRAAWATGVHYCENLKEGVVEDADVESLRLYHYHGFIGVKGEVCRDFTDGLDGTPNWLGIKNCTVDRTLTKSAQTVKQYELDTIGKQPYDL